MQNIELKAPKLWSPEQPYLYKAKVMLYAGDKLKDVDYITFGVRSIEYSPEKGFVLNGKTTKFKGGCLHHDLGPFGYSYQ